MPVSEETTRQVAVYPLGLTRRVFDWAAGVFEHAWPHRWWWRGAMVVAIGAWAFQGLVLSTGAAALFVAAAVLMLVGELAHLFVDAPMLVFGAAVYAILTLSSVADVLLYTRHVARPRNRIALWVLLINLPFALYALAWITLT